MYVCMYVYPSHFNWHGESSCTWSCLHIQMERLSFHLIKCVSHNRPARQKVNDDIGPVQETGPKRDVGTLSQDYSILIVSSLG